MAYDYMERTVETWDFAAQCAIWRERALHQARRAAFYKALAEAERNGTTINPSAKEPAL